jgi:hypothetical protein
MIDAPGGVDKKVFRPLMVFARGSLMAPSIVGVTGTLI